MPESIEHQIRKKMLRNVNENFGGIFASATLGHSVVGIPSLDDELELEASPVEAFLVDWN